MTPLEIKEVFEMAVSALMILFMATAVSWMIYDMRREVPYVTLRERPAPNGFRTLTKKQIKKRRKTDSTRRAGSGRK